MREPRALVDDEDADHLHHCKEHRQGGPGRLAVENRLRDTEGVNRLAEATSPYLLQHADNPVDWYPWGDEALDKAKSEDRPIFSRSATPHAIGAT